MDAIRSCDYFKFPLARRTNIASSVHSYSCGDISAHGWSPQYFARPFVNAQRLRFEKVVEFTKSRLINSLKLFFV
jgi:hypothetical protein